MATPRVSVPVTTELFWILPVPEHWLRAARVASPAALRELEALVAPPACPACARVVARALAALSGALEGIDPSDDPPAAPTD